jgi:dTDP-6-deoxy-L-talose 4-dehydrogenase (NAD+)
LKIAVTGANGFIGRHVLAQLAARDVDTVAVESAQREHAVSPRLRWVAIDLQAPSAGSFALLGRPDVLIHLAWGGLPNYKSAHHVERELPAHYRFLSDLVREGLPALVVAGTCLEYGFQSGAIKASAETRPSNPYAVAKDSLRRQLQFLQAQQPFELTWARLFYLYGDGQAASSLLPQLRAAVTQGLPVFNMSGGEQLRDYLPVEVVAQRLVELAMQPRGRGLINVCSGNPLPVRRLVEGWIAENHWDIRLNLGHYPYPDYEPMAFWGDPADRSE